MNLDDFISKYLDGELNHEEDEQLRQLLSGDDGSKAAFDSAVFINSAFKEDALRITPPKSLVSATEDKVLMKILSQQPVMTDRAIRTRRYTVLASFVVAMLLFGIFKINDLEKLNPTPMMMAALDNNRKTLENEAVNIQQSEPSGKRTINFNRNTIAVRSRSGNSVENLANSGIASNQQVSNIRTDALNSQSDKIDNSEPIPVNRFTTDSTTINNSPVSQDISTNQQSHYDAKVQQGPNSNANFEQSNIQIFKNPSDQSLSTANGSLNKTNFRNGSNQNSFAYSPFDNYSQNTDIQLASFLGTDLARMSGTNGKTIVNNYSQSVAYSMNNGQKMGIEFGYSSYNYNDNVNVSLPLTSANSGGKISSIAVVHPIGGNDYIQVPVSMSKNKQMFWGAAFYEYQLFDKSDFSINGRLGLGASNDGLMSYGRLYARYGMFDWLFLTIGAEGRLFESKIESVNTSQSVLNGATTLIYGLQVKF